MTKLILSNLPKTWIIDIDGVIFLHNSHLSKSGNVLNQGVLDFFDQIPRSDYILILTSRSSVYRDETLKALKDNNIPYNDVIFDLPHGERIVINDMKNSGLKTAIAINTERDNFKEIKIAINNKI